MRVTPASAQATAWKITRFIQKALQNVANNCLTVLKECGNRKIQLGSVHVTICTWAKEKRRVRLQWIPSSLSNTFAACKGTTAIR
jgi:hypothetical protein